MELIQLDINVKENETEPLTDTTYTQTHIIQVDHIFQHD